MDLAIERLRGSASALRNYEFYVSGQKRKLDDSVAKVKGAGAGLTDYAKSKRTQYERDDQTQKMEIGRYAAFADYNKALMALEDAIGVRIEKALNGWRDK